MRTDTVYSTPLYPVRFKKHWERTAQEERTAPSRRKVLIEYINFPKNELRVDTFERRVA